MANKKFYCEAFVEADITAVNFFINFEFVMIEYADLPDRKKTLIGQHENSILMHLRFKDFNKHRLDKLNLTPPHLYEPKHP